MAIHIEELVCSVNVTVTSAPPDDVDTQALADRVYRLMLDELRLARERE